MYSIHNVKKVLRVYTQLLLSTRSVRSCRQSAYRDFAYFACTMHALLLLMPPLHWVGPFGGSEMMCAIERI